MCLELYAMTICLPENTTLGILAGGRATRLSGIDKAWLCRDGIPQVLRWRARFAAETAAVLVSSNRPDPRWPQYGLTTVPDRHPDCGPLSGLDALANACQTPYLLTIPVDLVEIGSGLLQALAASAADAGAAAEDRDGPQPLLALWNVAILKASLPSVFTSGDWSVRRLQQRLQMRTCYWQGIPFGNLNIPSDLAAANVHPDNTP